MPATSAQIAALLPQTQCQKCGYNGCTPYAYAVSCGTATINQCAPGGQQVVGDLAKLLGVAEIPLDERFGGETPRQVAFIVEQDCIGCSKCLPPCPVDAIIGAPKQMHTVITADCTGCEMCIAPCPVDCIVLLPVKTQWTAQKAALAKNRYQAKIARAKTEADEKIARIARQKPQRGN